MTISGTYLCQCKTRFQGTFDEDEESICPACQDKLPKPLSIQATSDFIESKSLEEIATIPYL